MMANLETFLFVLRCIWLLSLVMNNFNHLLHLVFFVFVLNFDWTKVRILGCFYETHWICITFELMVMKSPMVRARANLESRMSAIITLVAPCMFSSWWKWRWKPSDNEMTVVMLKVKATILPCCEDVESQTDTGTFWSNVVRIVKVKVLLIVFAHFGTLLSGWWKWKCYW